MPKPSEEIESKARAILTAKYDVQETTGVPEPENVPYGDVAKKFKATVFAIDIRNSSKYLAGGDLSAGKIHKAFLGICAKTVHHFDGQIRSFNGDGLLAFWSGEYKSDLTPSLKAAMGIKWLITSQMKDLFIDKHAFDFGIGLSWGTITCCRVGMPQVPSGNDLVFLDRSINEAVVISKQANDPYHIECTLNYYDNLEEDGLKAEGKPMWKDGNVTWKNGDFKSKITTFHWSF